MSVFANPSFIRIAQVVGIGASGYLTGFHSCGSFVAVPPLYLAPPHIAVRQWAVLYRKGRAIVPGVAGAALLAHLYLAYYAGHYASATEGYAYLAAGLCTFAIGPYTLLVMMSTNNELEELAESKDTSAIEASRVTALLEKWETYNIIRSVGPTVGFITGILALGGFF